MRCNKAAAKSRERERERERKRERERERGEESRNERTDARNAGSPLLLFHTFQKVLSRDISSRVTPNRSRRNGLASGANCRDKASACRLVTPGMCSNPFTWYARVAWSKANSRAKTLSSADLAFPLESAMRKPTSRERSPRAETQPARLGPPKVCCTSGARALP